MKKLTHLDEKVRAKMVDVSEKQITRREAVARGSVYMKPGTIKLIKDRKIPKGDVFSVAKIAGIVAAKKTSELIPLCHPLSIVSVAALTIYDMCKAVDKEMVISDIMLMEKKGGRSGHFKRRR